ncbi:hypothetical protein PVAND_009613 [Polypedilum vanderplanki]|uniref:Uncharacterized protein n=1 Tax=Polypedilum vanderplanki TaxID=319348 RepID=A0A9J6CDR2_POLVA|nr:hypothetical protein PVAND_009613 [Polypedilum vanderplanki]
MTKEENIVQTFLTRDYQRNIIDVCLKRNSIVFLPTGAGKTYIAIQVIKHFSNQLGIKYSEGGKRSVFLVNTVYLAKQQAEAIQFHIPFNVRVVTGEENVDAFEESDWLKILDNNEVLVMTAQCFHDAVNRTFIKMNQIRVVIFDECHHGRKDHVYHQLMQSISNKLDENEFKNLRIIGLSGMLIGVDNSIKPYLVADEMKRLESTFQSVIITVNNLDDHKNVILYSTKAIKTAILFNMTACSKTLVEVKDSLLCFQTKLEMIKLDNLDYINPRNLRKTIPKRIKELINILKDFEHQALMMGNFGAYISLVSIIVQLELNKRAADSERYRDVLKMCITKVEECIKKVDYELCLNRDNATNIIANSSHKVQTLIELLQKSFTDENREKDLQCIIFVERRSTAKILYHIIKMLANSMFNFPLRPDFIVGCNNDMPESIDAILNKSFNKMALDKFNRNETNCVICTNVLEEGIDVQACNLVIMYDKSTTPRSFFQSCGRARDNKSKYIVMLEQRDIEKFKKNVNNWNCINDEMKKQLIGKTLDRELPSDESIQNEQQQSWEPYLTKSGSELNALNAINILNQYCMSLPFDKYTKYRESYRRIDHKDGTCQVAIQMPISSMIREEIFGEPKENVRLAKQHAAFEACKILIENGSLTDKLTPIDSLQKIEEFNDEYFSHWEKYKNDEKSKAGTKNNRRYHKSKVPDVLKNCGPSLTKTNYLYTIRIKPDFDTKDDFDLKVFHELIDNENTFGILTTKRIPRICKIPLFQSYGKIVCEIISPPIAISIENEKELDALRRFHLNIFCDVLKVFKSFLALDKSSYLIVPLDKQNGINWTLLEQFETIHSPVKLSKNEIMTMSFKPDDYLYKVLNPVYRETDQNYVVIKVLEHKNPQSAFPSEKAKTYYEYYLSKDHQIYRNDQFLVQVKGISKNLNLFFPGAGVSGDKKSTRNLLEEYVPELCHNYKFPAAYWLKATLLPSICHRLHYLLLAQELHTWLIKEKIDLGRGTQNYEELDIDYGNYEDRNKKVEQYDEQILEQLDNFEQILKEQKNFDNQVEQQNKNTLLICNSKGMDMPIDFDRNLLTVTEADLDYYAYFTGQTKSSGFKTANIDTNRGSRKQLSLKDDVHRKDIKLLDLTSANSSIQQRNLIKVITTAKSGDVFDMERFETLGDAFLKFISSLYLFKNHVNLHEGHLSALKGRLVSNRNLFYIGNEFGLSNLLKTTQFCSGDVLCGLAPSAKIPSSIQACIDDKKSLINHLVDVKLSKEEMQTEKVTEQHLKEFRMEENEKSNMFCVESGNDNVDTGMLPYINENNIGDKIIADAVEALIGCVVSSTGPTSALKLCHKLKIIPSMDESLLNEKIPPRVPFAAQVNIESTFDKLEKIIGYKFNDKLYLCQALTHTSYPIKDAGTYENLEFLGDAVLDFLITSYISEQCPKMSPGKLTDLRSALVNNVTLACIIVRKEIYKFLKAECRTLYEIIKKFVEFQKAQNNKVTDDVILLTTDEETSSAEAVNVPKVLGDIFESIIGAVFCDSNNSLSKTWNVIYNLMKEEIHEFISNVPLQVVRRLYEYHKGNAEPKFYESRVLPDDEGVAVPLKFKCRGEEKIVIGIGKNRKIAKNAAAKRALNYLEKK